MEGGGKALFNPSLKVSSPPEKVTLKLTLEDQEELDSLGEGEECGRTVYGVSCGKQGNRKRSEGPGSRV